MGGRVTLAAFPFTALTAQAGPGPAADNGGHTK